ncbi:hypothetical protein Tco_1196712 [Tanacetum coccineum]
MIFPKPPPPPSTTITARPFNIQSFGIVIDQAENENDENETENENDEDEAENENDGDEVEAEARVLRICRFDLSTQTFEQIECNGVYHRPDDGD